MKQYGKEKRPDVGAKPADDSIDLPVTMQIQGEDGGVHVVGGKMTWRGGDLLGWSPAVRPGDVHRASGRVGVGTSEPQYDLHVEGAVYGTSLRIKGLAGVLKADRGNVSGGACLDDVSDVRVGNSSDGDVLVKRGDS